MLLPASRPALYKNSVSLPEDFNSFCNQIDKMNEIDNSTRTVDLENYAPAVFKYLEKDGGIKYLIGFSAALGHRTIRYFIKGNNMYIEDINAEYNKPFYYKEDTTAFKIISEDTAKYFFVNNLLIEYTEIPANSLTSNQIGTNPKDKTAELLNLLNNVKQKAGM